jgi:Ca2+/Na+ antiporter
MMFVILQLSDFLSAWLERLEAFKEIKNRRSFPFLVGTAIFVLFSYWEGYMAISNPNVLLMYAVMVILGLFYSWKHSIEWNTSLVVVSIAVGGYMELLGSMAGYWAYHFNEPLAMFFVLSWAMNTMAVHGLAFVLGIDLGDVGKRHLLPSKKKHRDSAGEVSYEDRFLTF